MRYLIIVDRKYPFGKGEAYLENEIEFLVDAFDRIMIFPTDISKKEVATRNIPYDCVSLHPLNKYNYSSNKYYYLYRTVFTNFTKKKLYSAKGFEELYTDQVVETYYKKVESVLDSITFKENDQVFLYSYWLYTPSLIIINLKKYLRARNINCVAFSRAHRFDIYEEERGKKGLPHRKKILTNIDKVFSISDDGYQYLTKKYPKFSSKMEVSKLGTIDRGISKKKKGELFHLVSVSRVTDVKRVDRIVDALSNLSKESKAKIRWTHIGDGNKFDNLTQLCKNNISDIEYNLMGEIPNVEVIDFFKNNRVDLFINVSSSEGIPVSIMEAISFGIPVVATDVGGSGEIVKQNCGVLLNKEFNTVHLVEVLTNYINMDQIEMNNKRNAARQVWIKNFSAEANYIEFVKKVNRLL
ncbi:glycosyltransferase [Bavariicoccus seileri]|nr:glycosyltransferase [Bavariicoccus seileri]